MSKNRKRKYTVVITDGSNVHTVKCILEWFDCLTNRRFGKTKCRQLSKEHPTTLVVKTKMREDSFNLLQNGIESVYPGLCVFNPPM